MKAIDTKDESIDTPTARINTTSHGEVLGCALFLGRNELRQLGVDDAGAVQYEVRNGDLTIMEDSER